MKKYVIIALLFLPVMSMAAPSVKKFGSVVSVASGGVKPSVASKVTPAKTITATLGANKARVGSLRLKSATTASATAENTGASTNRLSVFPSLKVFNSAAAPKANNNNASIQEIDDLTARVENIEEQQGKTTIVTHANTLVRHDDTVNIGEPWDYPTHTEVEGRRSNMPPEGRAWIWIEQ